MLRRLLLWVAGVAVLGVAAFWILTMPSTVPTSALGPHTPDLANGKEMFLAGGCTSCLAVPKQEDSNKLGGGLGLVSAFGLLCAQYLRPTRTNGIGGWAEAQFITALTKGPDPEAEHLFPIFPYTSYQWMPKRRPARPVRLHQELPPVAGEFADATCRSRSTFAPGRRLEAALPGWQPVQARPVTV